MKALKFCAGVFLLFAACSTSSPSKRLPASSLLQTRFLTIPHGNRSLNLRIGIQNPDGPVIGDVLYIHGFADRLDNHAPLFDAWTRAGLRVIAFDLPSHGEDSGSNNDLNYFNFEALVSLAAQVEEETKAPETADVKRPLILAGWSTGGLIITRLLQKSWLAGFSRPISGVILFAPGVSVRKFPWTFGNKIGEVTLATLTHDPHPPHVGPIQPGSPFWSKLAVGFAPRLVANSVLSQAEEYPLGLKTLVFSGGDAEDVYAKAWAVRGWVDEQNALRNDENDANIISISCPHAMHEMDNELPEYGGVEVRETAVEFAREVALDNKAPFFEASKPYGTICSRVDHEYP